MDHGIIFDIERFATADGPGIRTVVFFKGCNLHCYWCHNPESINPRPQLEFDQRKCIGCGACFLACPVGAQILTEQEHGIDFGRCRSCFACAKQCPVAALKQVGNQRTVEDCMAEIREDIPFYQSSGGGVTLSGGEVLMQADFAGKLLRQCKEEGVHTAMESNLCLPWETVEKLLPYVDLVFADIKHMNPEAHRQGTGMDNRYLLENLQKINAAGKPIVVRTPIIGGFNSDQENIRQTAAFLKNLENLQYYELLSYNPLGNEKRERLGMTQKYIKKTDRGQLSALVKAAQICEKKVWLDGKIQT